MNKNWLLGFVEGEGCFSIIIKKGKNYAQGYQVHADFSIKSTASERETLELIRNFLGEVGHIYHQDSKKKFLNTHPEAIFKVTKLEEIKKIVDFFKDLQFISQSKKQDFENWCKCIELIEDKQHLTKEGLLKISYIRDKIHKRKQWNKQNYCMIKSDVDPCEIYLKKKEIPINCNSKLCNPLH
jgi:hypothetical protein